MRSFSTLAVLALPLFGSVFAEQPKTQPEQPSSSSIYSSAHEAFQDLLNALPEESLKAALSGLKDFQNGIFESHHRGVEQVHNRNPALATKLIVAAVNDLKKRQTPSNGTVVAPPPPAESTPPAEQSDAPPPPANTPADTPEPNNPPAATPTPAEEPPVLIPVPETVTDNQGQTVVRTSSILSKATASVAVTLTRTNAQGSTVRVTENRPAVIRTLTDARGRVTTTTSAAQFVPTPGEVRTETDGQGKTFVTTYTPGGGKVSLVKLMTTTGPDGKLSVITSYEYVDPITTPTPAAGEATKSQKPGLQTGAAVVNKQAVVGYALAGGALAMFV